MDESFELLSSMSPKRVLKQKPSKKGATVLALKRNIRRSSIYEKANPTVKNEDLYIVESNFTESTTNSVKSDDSMRQHLNQTPIVISDTDESCKSIENDKPLAIEEDAKASSTNVETQYKLLPDNKIEDIKRWIASVDIDTEKRTDVTTFSEVSTIYGDTNATKFIPKVKGSAVNSTFVDLASRKFDELFENRHAKRDLHSSNSIYDEGLKETFKDFMIDDSLETRLKKKFGNKACTPKSKSIIAEKKSTPAQSNKVFQDSSNDPKTDNGLDDNKDLECMLDSLYGEQWRKKQDLILPKTEPRKNNVLKSYNVTNSERKPESSLIYKNPYLEIERSRTNGLLKNLQTSRLKANLESPLLSRLKLMCDSDSVSEKSTDNQVKPQTLNFNDNSSDEDALQDRRTSKYFKKKQKQLTDSVNGMSNKENVEELHKNNTNVKASVRKKITKPDNSQVQKTVKSNKEMKVNGPKISTKSETDSSNSSTKMKTDKKSSNSNSSTISVSSDEEWDRKIGRIHRSSLANGMYSFLESLSGNVPILRCDMRARIYRSNFKMHRDQLLNKLFKLYDERIFDNAIPHNTTLEWNDRMRGTAGFCYCKKITRRDGAVERSVRIVLASKVVDSADRLRDTLVHEMCHAATWIVNCISDGHGRYWKAWALKAMKAFPELPPIRRCHDYVINTKYTYKCTGCGYCIGRHTKSLDIERKRCGHCYGKFEVLINKTTKKGETKSVIATPKKEATGFALFVKENYGIHKNPLNKHGDVMKILGQKFQEMKLKK